jgi:hypothetical protein
MISGLVVWPEGLSWILLELLIKFQKVEPNAVQFCLQLLLSTVLIKIVYLI